MKTLLEQALIAQLNGKLDEAEELLHRHLVTRSRQIHESIRNEEEFDINEEAKFEDEYLEEIDLSDLTAETDVDADVADLDATVEGDDFGDADVVDAEVDFGEPVEDEVAADDDLESLKDQLADIMARLDDMISADDTVEGDDFGDEEVEIVDGDVDGGEAVDTLEDDMEIKEGEGDDVDFTEEDFDDIAESVSILKPVRVDTKDGEETGGKSFKTNDKSPVAKSGTYRAGATVIKSKPYTSNDLQKSSGVKDLKGVGSNVGKSAVAPKKVGEVDTKEGTLAGEKKPSVKVQTKSPTVPVKK